MMPPRSATCYSLSRSVDVDRRSSGKVVREKYTHSLHAYSACGVHNLALLQGDRGGLCIYLLGRGRRLQIDVA